MRPVAIYAAVVTDLDIDLAPRDPVEIRRLRVLVAAAEILEHHDPHAKRGQGVGDGPPHSSQILHLARTKAVRVVAHARSPSSSRGAEACVRSMISDTRASLAHPVMDPSQCRCGICGDHSPVARARALSG
jgi:hypothetical protein